MGSTQRFEALKARYWRVWRKTVPFGSKSQAKSKVKLMTRSYQGRSGLYFFCTLMERRVV